MVGTEIALSAPIVSSSPSWIEALGQAAGLIEVAVQVAEGEQLHGAQSATARRERLGGALLSGDVPGPEVAELAQLRREDLMHLEDFLTGHVGGPATGLGPADLTTRSLV